MTTTNPHGERCRQRRVRPEGREFDAWTVFGVDRVVNRIEVELA